MEKTTNCGMHYSVVGSGGPGKGNPVRGERMLGSISTARQTS